jgi:RimJ/RimL family protein N-acetyltransferase
MPQISDAEAIFTRYGSDPEVVRYVGWPRHADVTDTREFLEFSRSEWQLWPVGPLLIEELDTGRLVGATGLAFDSIRVASTGCVLARDTWGKGFASEALAAIVQLARQNGMQRLYARCHVANLRSRRMLERCFFALEATKEKHAVYPNIGATGLQDECWYSVGTGAI